MSNERNILDGEVTLNTLQTELRWGKEYSADYKRNPQPHRDLNHALLHIVKAVGKLFELCDEMDHGMTAEEFGKYHMYRYAYMNKVADILISAVRCANVFPGGSFNLGEVTALRVKEKEMVSDEKKSEG